MCRNFSTMSLPLPLSSAADLCYLSSAGIGKRVLRAWPRRKFANSLYFWHLVSHDHCHATPMLVYLPFSSIIRIIVLYASIVLIRLHPRRMMLMMVRGGWMVFFVLFCFVLFCSVLEHIMFYGYGCR